MEKKICTLVCLMIAFLIGLLVVNSTPEYMRAASGESQKIIDFDIASVDQGVSGWDAYAISETHHLYYVDLVNRGRPNISQLLMDDTGKPLSNVQNVSGGDYGNCKSLMALRSDGTLYMRGKNTFGQFGNGAISDTCTTFSTIVEPGVQNIIAVESGLNTNYILTSNGEVYASGDNQYGQFGNGTLESSTTFTKVHISDVKKIAVAGSDTVFALKHDGTVYGWGRSVYNGKESLKNVTEPNLIYTDENEPFRNVIDIDASISQRFPALVVLTDNSEVFFLGKRYSDEDTSVINYGQYSALGTEGVIAINVGRNVNPPSFYGFFVLGNGKYYVKQVGISGGVFPPKDLNYIKVGGVSTIASLSEDGELYVENTKIEFKFPLVLSAIKKDNTIYESGEKHNDSIILNVTSSSSKIPTCLVEDPVGNAAQVCEDFSNNSVNVDIDTQRVYKKYTMTNDVMSDSFIIDLFNGLPQLEGYSSTQINKIKITDLISLTVPTEQKNWNTYTATITDSTNKTTEFTGGTLDKGTYTIHVVDAYGNTQDFKFEVSDKPEPTAIFTPSSADLVYKDAYTKINGTIGTFALQYPEGEPTSTIASIQLGTSGDESHFSIDTTGALKVKGNDLDAGTYNVTVSGQDANKMSFTKTVQIIVGKANQDNYQITNDANYSFKVNQEVAITTSGNVSGERETYRITNGNTIAQITNTDKFKMLVKGTFTLEATVAGNNNYNSKTVTKQITLSELPTQTNPIKISSGDSIIYGNTYTPISTGGTGSGNVTWAIENDSGTGASLNNGSIRVTGIGTFTLKVTKAGDTNYQSSSDSKVITVNKRKTTVKPKDVTRKVGEAFKDNGVTYNPQPVSGDSLGTPIITSKYPTSQQAGRYTDGIQVTGLTNPNYDFEYQEGTLIINDTTLPNNGSGYYKITGTLGKNNWYVSDIKISTLNKDGYDQISSDGINFQTTPLIYQTDGDYQVTFYLKNSTTGIIAKGINYQVKIDQTPPTVPTLTMNQLNTSRMARLINFLSFGNWMNTGAEVIMSSTDGTSGIDNYSYVETDTKGTSNTKTSTTGKVTYQNDVEIGITAKACDKAGNCSDLSASETLMIDRKGPEITGVKDKSVYKYYYLPRFVKVKDNGSGLSYAEYLKDGAQAGTIQENVNERIDGVGKYEVYAIDNAGNESTLSFEIVPLPNIDDIDGSDESKDIIDQVKDEYEEVKDHLTDEERKEYEDWIKDAQDKWESERKKVIETDDKTSKVEGVGDTTFDPNLELIVDDITDQPLPLLPKKANVVYDVYLQKGNTKVEPDGSIKVYLPYTDNEDPIIYQIDENGKVTEIKAEKEGNYVTFITDELGKFAISNTAQPDNKDNMCVVGPDGKVESGDEVCGKPNDKGDQPTKKPDGSVEVPDGGKVEFPNGTEIDTPNGAIINPDGSVTLPDGTEYDPNGNIKDKDVCKLNGKDINIDTDDDGKPDVNIDIDGDCKPDINIDTDNDGIPNTNIDTDLDGKPDYNIDTDNDGKPNVNIGPVNDPWKPNTCGVVNEITFCTDSYKKLYLNIDSDGDGRPDINVDLDGDMEADINIDIDGDNIPDIDIDSDGDGKPDINVDTDNDGKADKNIVKITEWKPDKNVDGSIPYDTMSNVSSSNTDSNGNGNDSQLGANMGGTIGSAQTGDETKLFLWWIIVCINICMMIYCYRKVRKEQKQES